MQEEQSGKPEIAATILLSLLCWIGYLGSGAGRCFGARTPLHGSRDAAAAAPLPCGTRCLLQVRTGSDPAGSATLASLRHRQHLEARAAEEEDMFTRVPLSREDRRRLKADTRAGLAGQGAMLDDFADDVAGLVQVRCCCTVTYLVSAGLS